MSGRTDPWGLGAAYAAAASGNTFKACSLARRCALWSGAVSILADWR